MVILRYLILIFAVFASARVVLAADLLDPIYREMNQLFKDEDCPKESAACAHGSLDKSNKNELHKIPTNVFFNQLAAFEIDRLTCGKQQWDSYSSSTETGKQNQQLKLNQMNEILGELQSIKNKIESLSRELSTATQGGPSALTLRNARKYNRGSQQKSILDEQQKAYIGNEEAKAQELDTFLNFYQQKISEIPHSDTPEVRDFIESRLSLFEEPVKTVSTAEYEKLVQTVSKSFSNSINKLKNSASLSIEEKSRFSSDATLIGQVLAKNEFTTAQVKSFQCLAANEMKVKSRVENSVTTGVTVLSFALPVGALGAAQLARTSMVIKSPQMVASLNTAARVGGWSAASLGSAMAAHSAIQACTKISYAQLNRNCAETPETILQEHSFNSCAWNATMAALPGAIKAGGGFLATRLADKNSALAKFIEENAGRKNLRSQDLKFAGNLDDGDRIRAAEGILGRALSPNQKSAMIKAHEIGKPPYSPAEIEEKRKIMQASGFSLAERETLLWKNITGVYDSRSVPEILIKLPESANKSRLLGEYEAAAVKGNPEIAAKHFKDSTSRYKKEIDWESPTSRDYSVLEYSAANWGAKTKVSEEVIEAEKTFIDAFQKRMKKDAVQYRARDNAEQVIENLKTLRDDPGIGHAAEVSKWRRRVIIEHYKKKGWNLNGY